MSTVPAVIGQYDLPDLAASVMPSNLLFVNPVNALGLKVDDHDFEQAYRPAMDYSQELNVGKLIVFVRDNQVEVNEKILNWIKN